jgi:hypothetical protein
LIVDHNSIPSALQAAQNSRDRPRRFADRCPLTVSRVRFEHRRGAVPFQELSQHGLKRLLSLPSTRLRFLFSDGVSVDIFPLQPV